MAEAKTRKDTRAKCEVNAWPAYIDERLALWHKFMQRHRQELAAKVPSPVRVQLDGGVEVAGESWRTTPLDVARAQSQALADAALVARVDGRVWDLERPLETDCRVELLTFDDDDGKQVFWHSSAHVTGEAMERYYAGCLCYGPPIESGFYYDMYLPDATVKHEELPHLEAIAKCIVADKQPFERLELPKDDLLQLFKYNPFKLRILNEKVTEATATVYRCGPLIDLCRGPHVRHTGRIRALAITKSSAAFWEGKSDAETLQRVYGISFPDAKQLAEWKKFQEEAAKRDHRKIGTAQELFMFHGMSPGSAFFLPNGTHIYNTILALLRKEYRRRGYSEVITPNIFDKRLWEQSGHWDHYAKNMFKVPVDDNEFGLKPMNCPGHCLMYGLRPRTYNELPIRFADFGVLHRNEPGGALSGLTRVRRFQQDDAHIFCRSDQIVDEIMGCLDFLSYFYESVFGFTFKLWLSTRPDADYLGDISTWDEAEGQLRTALDAFGRPWKLNAGDGAFYGPKIDIMIEDALRRSHQCATLQLDFQLPHRFQLQYTDAEGQHHRPVIIHRAIAGSMERFIAVVSENYGGKWPFWLSPRQAVVVSVAPVVAPFARSIRDQIYAAGFECDADVAENETINRKIRNAQMAQYNFILVVGEKEMAAGDLVSVRTRDNKRHGELPLADVLARFGRLRDAYSRNSDDDFLAVAAQPDVSALSVA